MKYGYYKDFKEHHRTETRLIVCTRDNKGSKYLKKTPSNNKL